MAASTGIVITAGGLSLLDLIVTDWQPAQGLRISVATVAAAYVSAGLDKVVPGLGTGLAVLLVMGVILRSGPRIAGKLWPEEK